jgi:hypothetical protein
VTISLDSSGTLPGSERPTRAGDTVLCGVRVPSDVLEFCVQNVLVGALSVGLSLAQRHFAADSIIRLYLERDPEEHDDYVMLEVNSARASEEDLKSQLKFSEDWSAAVEWPESRLILLDVVSSPTHAEP